MSADVATAAAQVQEAMDLNEEMSVTPVATRRQPEQILSAMPIPSTTSPIAGLRSPPTPTGRRYYGMPVPSWFREDSAAVFRSLPVKDDDILLLSFPKSGTTWLWKILSCLIHLRDDGTFPDDYTSSNAQPYFCALPKDKPKEPSRLWGDAYYMEMISQPSPRLFSTHNPPQLCPKGFEKAGRVIYILRNPRDCLVSLHYMNGEPEDGWEGSFKRFMSPKCPNAFGSFFDHVNATEPFMKAVGPRGLVIFYENFKEDFDGQVQALAQSLGITLTAEKLAKLKEVTHISHMKKGNTITVRKGSTGEWRSHFTPEQSMLFDRIFAERLGQSKLAKMLVEA